MARLSFRFGFMNYAKGILDVMRQLLDGQSGVALSLSDSMDTAIRLLMVTWYASVGIRIGSSALHTLLFGLSLLCCTAVMYLTHLPPTTKIYQYLLPPPLALSFEPTVDRTLEVLLHIYFCKLSLGTIYRSVGHAFAEYDHCVHDGCRNICRHSSHHLMVRREIRFPSTRYGNQKSAVHNNDIWSVFDVDVR